jgi:hypothetical protein
MAERKKSHHPELVPEVKGGGRSVGKPETPSKKALHLCLKRLETATDENEIRRLTEELQRILFHKQYENAEA